MSHDPEYLTADELRALAQGERLLIEPLPYPHLDERVGRFAVISKPGDDGHPVVLSDAWPRLAYRLEHFDLAVVKAFRNRRKS